MWRKTILGCAAVLMTVLIAVAEPPSGAEGRMARVTGKVTVERDGQKTPARPGMELLGGDVIVTEAKSEAAIDLGDGRIITVKERSHFEIDERGPEKEDISSGMLYYGMVYVRKPAGAQVKQFQIQTPTAVAGVRGTNFGVAVAPDGSSIFGVEEGEITVETEGGGASTVGPMQEVTVDSDVQARLRVQQYRPNQQSLETWQKQRLELVLKNPIPAVRKLSITISAKTQRGSRLLEEIQKLLKQALDGSTNLQNFRRLGQSEPYNELRDKIGIILKTLLPSVRRLVRIDNNILARRRLLNIILSEAMAEGSPTPPRQAKMIKDNMQKIMSVEKEAAKLHQGRVRLMRVQIPEFKKALADFY